MDTVPKLRYTKESNFLFTVNWGEKKERIVVHVVLVVVVVVVVVDVVARKKQKRRKAYSFTSA